MKLTSSSFGNNERIPGEFAFCVPDERNHVSFGGNMNPHLAWSDLPPGARSLVLVCHDPDVPSTGEDVNKEGRTVAASLARVDFFHWVLVDLPAQAGAIAVGEFSNGVTPRGKPGPAVTVARYAGARQGINDYTNWFAGDNDMSGSYFGYDGPCPPWNDELAHRYVFTLYALDIGRCTLEGEFTGTQVRQAIAAHILAQASLTGMYTLNPKVRP